MQIKQLWTDEEIKELYELPLLKLVSKAHLVHLEFHEVGEVQLCQLISIKTGGCPEDCKYCAQSSRYQTSTPAQAMMEMEEVISMAKEAKERGATRVCLGAAWRSVRDGKQFDQVLAMVRSIADLDMEVCCTLGMLNEQQAQRLKQAGLYAYNHNLDTSENYYKTIITTRKYQDRLKTLDVVQKANLSTCCGGIIGMGESVQDRLDFLKTLANRNPHPESVPINRLTPIAGTPLGEQPMLCSWEVVRMVAMARILMPTAMVRLSSGRLEMSHESQALAFFAGANSIFMGEKLLTVANTSLKSDEEMFEILGLEKRVPFAQECCA